MKIGQQTLNVLASLVVMLVIGGVGIAAGIVSQERTPVPVGENAEALKNELRLKSEEIKALKAEVDALKAQLAKRDALIADIRAEKVLSVKDEFRKREDAAELETGMRNWIEMLIHNANQNLPPNTKELPSEIEVRQIAPMLDRFAKPVSDCTTNWLRALQEKNPAADGFLKQRDDLIREMNAEYDRIFGLERGKRYHFDSRPPQSID